MYSIVVEWIASLLWGSFSHKMVSQYQTGNVKKWILYVGCIDKYQMMSSFFTILTLCNSMNAKKMRDYSLYEMLLVPSPLRGLLCSINFSCFSFQLFCLWMLGDTQADLNTRIRPLILLHISWTVFLYLADLIHIQVLVINYRMI